MFTVTLILAVLAVVYAASICFAALDDAWTGYFGVVVAIVVVVMLVNLIIHLNK